MGQLPFDAAFVSICIIAVLGPAVLVRVERAPVRGDTRTADSKAMVLSPVAKFVVLPVLGGVVPGGVTTGGGVGPGGVGVGQT